MASDASNFLYGAVAGGVVALILRVVETYWLGPRLAASREAREKLLLYFPASLLQLQPSRVSREVHQQTDEREKAWRYRFPEALPERCENAAVVYEGGILHHVDGVFDRTGGMLDRDVAARRGVPAL